DLLTDFDCPDCAFPASTRTATTTPLQALTLFNHEFTVSMANALAARVQKDVGEDRPADQLRRAYWLLFARPPSDQERPWGEAFVAGHGLPALCRVLLNTNEFLYVE